MKQKFTEEQKEQNAFRLKYCRLKVWISFKNGSNKNYLIDETKTTAKQLKFKKVNTIIFSPKMGVDKCFNLIEQKFAGQYHTAIIYLKHKKDWHLRVKYVNGSMVENLIKYPIPPDEVKDVIYLDDDSYYFEPIKNLQNELQKIISN